MEAITKLPKTEENKGTKRGKSKKLTYSDEGQFEIIAPYLSQQWPKYTEMMSFRMSRSQGGSHLWALFNFGIISGVLRSTGRPSNVVDDVCHFLWRGEENSESQTMFGPNYTESITFLGDGKIKARMQWMGEFEFLGRGIPRKNMMWSKSVAYWKKQWRGYNESTYERARVSRWGGTGRWGHEDKGMVSPNSDADSAASDIFDESDSEFDETVCM